MQDQKTGTLRGVIYARYSSDNQREESIDGQLRECHAYADAKGIEIVHEYIDRAFDREHLRLSRGHPFGVGSRRH
jgi:DNA invertase Pin-like site-specific DNA recombinase